MIAEPGFLGGVAAEILSLRRGTRFADISAVEAELDTLPDSKNPDLSIRDDYFADTTARYCLVQLNDTSFVHFKEQLRAALYQMDANCCGDASKAKKD